MKTLKCNCGKDILLDDDYHALLVVKETNWSCANGHRVSTTVGYPYPKPITWFILGKPSEGLVTDHIDLDFHNNQRENLRAVTRQQNSFNRGKRSDSQQKYKGVAYDGQCKKPFRAYIREGTKKITLGRFFTEEEAALCYNEAAKRLFGEHAYLNVIQ